MVCAGQRPSSRPLQRPACGHTGPSIVASLRLGRCREASSWYVAADSGGTLCAQECLQTPARTFRYLPDALPIEGDYTATGLAAIGSRRILWLA